MTLLLLLMLAAPVQPQERTTATEAIAVAFVASALDWWTTEHLLEARNGRELNPLGQSSGKRLALSMGTSAAAAWLIHAAENGGEPGKPLPFMRRLPRWIWITLHALAASWNLWQAGRAR